MKKENEILTILCDLYRAGIHATQNGYLYQGETELAEETLVKLRKAGWVRAENKFDFAKAISTHIKEIVRGKE